MQFGIDIWFTLALAATALVVGRMLVNRIAFLSRYSIPDAVAGGLLFAAVILLLRSGGGLELNFDPALLTPLNVMFFTTVGLAADARSLVKGGKLLVVYLALVACALVMQNGIGVTLARLFDIHPVNGLMAGSITLSGGHGTAAAWGSKFAEERNVQGIVELGIAAATYGLVLGGVLGGPFASWLMRRHRLQGPLHDGRHLRSPTSHAPSNAGAALVDPAPAGISPAPLERKGSRRNTGDSAAATETPSEPDEAIRASTLIETLLLIFVSMAVGFSLYEAVGRGAFTLPSFIWALLVGAVLRNLLSLTGLYRVDDRALELIGTLALSLFLAMVIMTLKLWELVDLAGPIITILLVQTLAILAFCAFVTFRFMGRDYDAVLLATGHLGFAMGSTATAMVNVQAVTERYGHSNLAFLLIPVMGAFLVDLANALIIQGYLSLPAFGW